MQHVINHLDLVEHFSFAADKQPPRTADSSTGSRVQGENYSDFQNDHATWQTCVSKFMD